MNHGPTFWIDCCDGAYDIDRQLGFRSELVSQGLSWLVAQTNRAAALGFHHITWKHISGRPNDGNNKPCRYTPSSVGPATMPSERREAFEECVPRLRKAPYICIGAAGDRPESPVIQAGFDLDPFDLCSAWRTKSRLHLQAALGWWFSLGVQGLVFAEVSSALQRERLTQWVLEHGRRVAFEYPRNVSVIGEDVYRHTFYFEQEQFAAKDTPEFRNSFDEAQACIHLLFAPKTLHMEGEERILSMIKDYQERGLIVDASDHMSPACQEACLNG